MDFDRFSQPPVANQRPVNINMRCPRCRRDGSFHALSNVADTGWQVLENMPDGAVRITGQPSIGIRACPNAECSGYVFVLLNGGKLVRSYPPEVIDFDASSLPANIVATLEEAVKCHAAGCYRAAALMIRRALEEVCEDKKATGNNLKERIVALGSTIVVPPELIAAADELRLLGNDAAHIEAKTVRRQDH